MLFIKLIWPVYKKYLLKRAQIVGDQVLSFINEGDELLDFGCAFMLTSKYIFEKKKINLTGLDVVEYKKGKVEGINFVKYEGGKLPFKANRFDVVISLFVLHHTNNPDYYLNELARVSKKTIVICEDTYSNEFEKSITKLICWFSNFIVGDTNLERSFRSIKEWKHIFDKSKLKVVKFSRFYPYIIRGIPTKNVVMVLQKN